MYDHTCVTAAASTSTPGVVDANSEKIMQARKNPTEMEKLLVELCDADGDFTNLEDADALIEYMKG